MRLGEMMVGTVPAVVAVAAGERRRDVGGQAPLRWPVGVALAVVAGLALLGGFPPYDWWWLAPVGVAALAAAAHRRRVAAGAGLGLLAGVVFFAPLLSWTNLHTGQVPWVLLFGLQAGYLALLGAASAVVSVVVDRARWAWPVVTGLLWVAQEALRDRTPFGGFPWGRLAFSQGDGPLLRFAVLGGAPLVTFVVGVVGGMVVMVVWRPWRRSPRAGRAAAGLVAALGLVVAGAAVPVGMGSAGGTVTVAIVQGNVPRMGLDFNAQRRAVLDNHVEATIELARRVAAGAEPAPDLVVWPENASDVDPLRNADARARIDEAAARIGVPILVGALLHGPGPGEVRNVGLVWEPGGGPDAGQVYVKRHPVPFAEYVPLRRIARLVSKEVDRVRADFTAGDRPGVLRVGPVVVGDVICFEVAYDGLVRDTVTGGAQLLVVQTNNATFNEAEARQQLAMVRLRAIEHGRAGLMASTVGVSGFVDRAGTVSDATRFNTAAVVVGEMDLGTTRTLATQLGSWPEMVLVVFAGAVFVVAVRVGRRRADVVDVDSEAW